MTGAESVRVGPQAGADAVETGADATQVEVGFRGVLRGGGGGEVQRSRLQTRTAHDGHRVDEGRSAGGRRWMLRSVRAGKVRHDSDDLEVAPEFETARKPSETEPLVTRGTVPCHAGVHVEVHAGRATSTSGSGRDGAQVLEAGHRELDVLPHRARVVGNRGVQPAQQGSFDSRQAQLRRLGERRHTQARRSVSECRPGDRNGTVPESVRLHYRHDRPVDGVGEGANVGGDGIEVDVEAGSRRRLGSHRGQRAHAAAAKSRGP